MSKKLTIKESVTNRLDTAKIMFKLKGYSKELSEKYVILGEMYYDKVRRGVMPNTEKLEDTLEEIEAIKGRIKFLNRNIIGIKQNVKHESAVVREQSFAQLDRKQGDLTIKRTKEGIKILRRCLVCGAENLSNAEECKECGSEMVKE